MKYSEADIAAVISEVTTDTITGLSGTEAAKRLQRDGYNRIKTINKRNVASIFLEQFKKQGKVSKGLLWSMFYRMYLSIFYIQHFGNGYIFGFKKSICLLMLFKEHKKPIFNGKENAYKLEMILTTICMKDVIIL